MIEKKTKLLEERHKTSENKFSYANLFWNGLDMSDIRQRAYLAWLTLFLGFCAMDVEAQAETELLRDVLSKPIKIERDEVVTSIPIQIRSGMLHLTASINDFTSEFVFDTGSPLSLIHI